MRHNFTVDGFAYKIRPIALEDAQFIIDLRMQDEDRNRFIHKISPDVELQKKWINDYFKREGDYYFVVENKLTLAPEGLIGLYNLIDGKAEWGRWVISKSSLAALESVDLILKMAFNILNLKEVFCRTIEDNNLVLGFHDSIGQKRRILAEFDQIIDLDNASHKIVEHYVDREHYFEIMMESMERKAQLVFQRNFRQLFGEMRFHHIGIATDNIDREFAAYKILGYCRESKVFEDKEQGIRGLFISAHNQPRLELLENLPDSSTLNFWLKNKIKMYHFAYFVKNIDRIIDTLNANKIKLVSPLKDSAYFNKRICFLVLSNMFMIELIEE